MSVSLLIREPLGERPVALPLRLGGSGADVVIPGAAEAPLRIDHSGGQFWVRPAQGMRVVVNGLVHAAPLSLVDGDVLQLGEAQIVFSATPPALHIHHLAGNATVAPLQEESLPGEVVVAGVAEIRAPEAVADAAWRSSSAVMPSRGRKLPLWLIAPAVVLAAALFVLFRLVNVPLRVAPEDAQVDVPGWFSWHSGERLFLMPGPHQVTVSAPRHESRVLKINTAALSEVPPRVELPLLPGILVVDTGGLAGEALVDGKSAGHVPGEISAPSGTHEVSVRAPRYVDFTARVEVRGGGDRQDLKMQLQPAYGWLVLDSLPAGGWVRIDDEVRGAAPLRVELDAGLRRLSITVPGRRPWVSQVAIQAGQTMDLGVIDLRNAPPIVVARVAKPAATPANPGPVPESASAAPPPPPPARVQSPLLGSLVLLPGGTFVEGSDRREQGRRSNEVQRQVTLSRPFYLAEKEVSNAQFRAFRPKHSSGLALEKSLDLDSQAVSNVTWNDAVEFCNWLSLREGLPAAYERRNGRWQLLLPHNHGYRLPTEAEWEYAARYVDGQRWQKYAWGDSLPPPKGAANLGGTESLPPRPGPDMRLASTLPDYTDEHAVVAPVGSYARSPAGLYDMGGNVSEWTHDTYASLPESAPTTDPFGPDMEGSHVVRGPNWRTSTIAGLRLAWREASATSAQTTGFRVARYVEMKP